MSKKQNKKFITPEILRGAVKGAFVKLNPRYMMRNPVMFVVEIGCFITLLLSFFPGLFGDVDAGSLRIYDIIVCVILFITVLFANFAEALAEGRGKAQADTLRSARTDTVAHRLLSDGTVETVSASELAPGDRVVVEAGDMIPADVRIVETKDLFVSQSSLTGESEPMEKWTAAQPQTGGNPLECNNLAFMGSTVVSGSALALVIAVGKDTLFGALARRVAETRVRTNFEKGVNAVSWVLIRFMVGMVPVVLFLNGFTKGDWVQAALFALSVAVGLTPEMLPMIVTTCLAKGAVSMSKKQVIVKHLNAIQNLGAMNILCTDKTGTLTQDRIVLEYPLDVHGNVDERVLRHAFLNSYHQTGLRNLMDEAIVDHAYETNMLPLWQDYRKVAEIPFDFTRRRIPVLGLGRTGPARRRSSPRARWRKCSPFAATRNTRGMWSRSPAR